MMLLATGQKRARTDLRRQSPARQLTAKIVGPEPLDFLADVADWPSIDALMHDRSLAMIVGQGISAWLGFGGQMRGDGLLSFGSVSDVGWRVLSERRASLDGFLWVDDSGTAWAVLPSPSGPDDEDRPAFALSWNGIAWPFDSGARWSALRNLAARMARASRPGRVWSQADRVSYARWARTCHQLRLVDLAMRVLDRLGARHGTIEFAAVDMPLDNTDPDADEIWAATCSATALQVAELRLGSLGWDPAVVRQATAVTELRRVSSGIFSLRLSGLWTDLFAAVGRLTRNTSAS